ncbi:dTDP-4-dehydrorhamnose reductase [Plantactinospora sp. KBS50]|uniref:dTDP-4-dehydrorhamnose reductase n=1 Tax=Plantactinospora sp. KBS50 TaxID=2024580 RepID=UPI000BAAE24F|nr:dTDP-4-dehydrorhamnose reductase [Plantactinospora sp. KBS50]ASW57687.1 dTDP-4-dehydrorhamnose reductase [Plantactinospora sp. KBS50]
MLGRELLSVLAAHPRLAATGATRAELDITDPAALAAAVPGHHVVINAAAWTDVDGAERQEAAATAVNGTAVGHLARACAGTGARLIQLSTDYVFAGTGRVPYPEDAPTAPVNAYGRGKLAGERAVARELPAAGYVVRTAWLYAPHGRNFVTTVLRLAQDRDRLDVVADQTGQPTSCAVLADRLVRLAEAALAGRAAPGVYHGTAAGQTTWYGLARAVFALRGLDPERIRPVGSDRFPRPAPRPRYSVLGHRRWAAAGLAPLPDWHHTLAEALHPVPA